MRFQKRTIALSAGLLLLGGVFAVAFWPVPKALLDDLPQKTIEVLDRHGELLYRQLPEGSGRTEPLQLSDVPPQFLSALLTTEDRTFYAHHGVSMRGIGRALFRNIQAGALEEGGSTLTEQYVRLRLGRRPNILGKLRDMLFALKLERRLSKDEILIRYLNTTSFGQGTIGIGAASRAFFGKTPKELSLAESAFMVGLLQSPTSLDPRKNFSGAKERQELVLNTMATTGAITEEQAEEAIALPIHLSPARIAIRAPHFVFWTLSEHADALETSGQLQTTLDLSLQTTVEDIVQRELAKLANKRVTSAAVVVLDAKSGEILAMVGSAEYFDEAHDGAVNVAVSARQPGSALKPFTYALALANGQTPASIIADIPTQFLTADGLPYTPRNYDFTTHGPVSLRDALGNSLNISAVRTLEKVGVSRLLSFLQDAGISTLHERPEFYGLALTLGAGEVRLLELAEAYGVFVRGGNTLGVRSLLNEPAKPSQNILDPRVAWLISDILSDPRARIVEFGDEGPLNFPYPVAAKTGTTRNSRDNWTIGYTPERIVGVWVGNADNTPMIDTSGVTGAGPIFHAVMDASMEGLPKEDFVRPPGIVEADVCRLTGEKPSEFCPGIRKEFFLAGTQPNIPDDTFRKILIDPQNGLLAREDCPHVEKLLAFFPAELRPWARDHGWPDPPSNVSPRCATSSSTSSVHVADASLLITQPQNGDRFRRSPIVPLEQQAIVLRATSTEPVRWYANGILLGEGMGIDHRFAWQAEPGSYRIEARTASASASVTIHVLAQDEE